MQAKKDAACLLAFGENSLGDLENTLFKIALLAQSMGDKLS